MPWHELIAFLRGFSRSGTENVRVYNSPVEILISAGEASGDMYGAQLIEALRRCEPSAGFFGAGGDRMRVAGSDTIVDAKDLAVVGITEVFSHLPKIFGLYKKLIRAADEKRPDIAVVIDAPAFNWRVARQMHKRGIPVVYYVCPQFWAWRQGRVKLLRKYVDKALVIFPFEEKFYRDRAVDATFVGHPLADLPMPAISRADYAAQYSLNPAKTWITLMPGSRRREVRMNLPTMIEAIARMGPTNEFLLPVARTVEGPFLEKLIYAETEQAPSLQEISGGIEKNAASQGLKPNSKAGPIGTAEAVPYPNPSIHLVSEALPALRHSRAAIVASGTATVEAALMETPFVMVYRVSPVTYALGKPRIKVPYFAMVNLIAGEEIVPELVQQKFTAENIVGELAKIIPDGPPREKMIRGLRGVRKKLQKPSVEGEIAAHPSERAAKIILEMVR